MSTTSGNDAQSAATGQAAQPLLQIEKLYVKDLSLEVPNAPQVFMQADSPQLEIQVRNEAAQFGDGLYEVVVTVTVTARAGEKTCFLAEVAQAGIFMIRGIGPADMEPLMAIGCPTILYPYAREAVSDMVARAGFPPVVLQPVSFEQLYMQRRQAASGGQAGATQ
jgi:preprotein translocase subunit SecB